MKKITLVTLVLTGFYTADGQDTAINFIKKVYTYPAYKPLVINYNLMGKSNYNSDLQNGAFEDGKITSNSRIRLVGTLPLLTKKKFSLRANINYLHEEFKLANVTNFANVTHKDKYVVDDASVSFSGLYTTMLWKKLLILNANLLLDSRDFTSVQRVRGLISAGMILKRTKSTIITAGLVGFIDPSVQIPVFPTITYWHKFDHSLWEFDAILPAKLMFRRSQTFNGWLSLGTEFTGNSFFNQNNNTRYPGNYELAYSELWMGMTYEYPVSKFLLAGIKTGVKKTLMSRMGEVNAKRKDYILQSNSAAAPYVSFSLSLTIPRKIK